MKNSKQHTLLATHCIKLMFTVYKILVQLEHNVKVIDTLAHISITAECSHNNITLHIGASVCRKITFSS